MGPVGECLNGPKVCGRPTRFQLKATQTAKPDAQPSRTAVWPAACNTKRARPFVDTERRTFRADLATSRCLPPLFLLIISTFFAPYPRPCC
jgi:hypothetical protein